MENNHSLVKEFPALADKIHELKVSDAHFRKMFDEYHEIDHNIHRIETEAAPTSDEHLNVLRIKRLQLKDALYSQLN